MKETYPISLQIYKAAWASPLFEETMIRMLNISMVEVNEKVHLFLLMELLESYQNHLRSTDTQVSSNMIHEVTKFIRQRNPHPLAEVYAKTLINTFNRFSAFSQTDQLFHVVKIRGYAYPRTNEFSIENQSILFAWDRGTKVLYWLIGSRPHATLMKQWNADIQNTLIDIDHDILTVELNIKGNWQNILLHCTRLSLFLEEERLEFRIKLPDQNRLVFMYKLDELMKMLNCDNNWEIMKTQESSGPNENHNRSFIGKKNLILKFFKNIF